ncbi:glycosyltransferase family 4 protein [Simiduia aestuariiviva]|uniref:Glycosyltransferase involved in cell wall biosynthesis n=1 Tax=Simiduia aestuariiviva TaxID=1510459 RepID=A0A839UTW6_9GAMM|nr:glycosyltransferase family 4 protein [Simiduia aestuariiviva]MBB3169890.1 glycosyltransferase involved in cell wall biosynthesis [Simiduia aestuariiviva]
MKICLVLMSKGFGGLEKHVVELANTLSLHHQVYVLTHADFKEHFDARVTLIPIDTDKSRFNPFFRRALKAKITAINPDVIHCHANKAMKILAAIKHQLGAPLVATIHGTKKNTRDFLAADALITVSNAQLDKIPHPNKHLIHNGVAPGNNTPQSREQLVTEFQLDPSKPLLGAVGRLAPVKGFDLLVQSLTNVDVNCIIFGDGQEKGSLRLAIEGAGLSHRIKLAGHRNDVSNLLPALDGVVISSHREGFPYILVEALQAERPMVSTPVSGSIEILPDRYLAKDFTPQALGDTITVAIADQQRWRNDTKTAIEFAKSELTLDAMAKKTIDLYQSLVKE